jgi:hypothetical protein
MHDEKFIPSCRSTIFGVTFCLRVTHREPGKQWTSEITISDECIGVQASSSRCVEAIFPSWYTWPAASFAEKLIVFL